MANNFPPLVRVVPSNLEVGKRTWLSALIDVIDLDGNDILRYRIRDNGSLNYSGFFAKAGVKLSAGQWYEFDASELSSVYFHAGLIESTESISVQVYDGRWSSVASGNIGTVTATFFPPVIETTNGSVLSNEIRQITDLFTVTDQDGDPIQQYLFVDRSPNALSGYFTLNGVRMPSASWFAVTPNDLPKLRYVSGVYGPQSETISIMATDGKFWSQQASLVMTTTANNHRPVVTALNVSSAVGNSTSVAGFFDLSDADGNTIKTISFRDTGVNPGSGYFTVNGVAQTQGAWFTIPYQQIDSVRYQYSNVGEVEYFDVQVHDGRYISQIKRGEIASIPVPTIDVPSVNIVLDNLEEITFSSIFTKTDGGPNFTLYEVIDATDISLSARVTLNGTPINQGVKYTFNPTQFANLEIQGAVNDLGRSYDQLLFRAYNGLHWTPWEEVNVLTEPGGPASLTTGSRWNNTVNGKTVVTYSFIDGQSPDGPRPPLPTYYDIDEDPEADGTIALDNNQRQAIRAILADIESYAHIDFVEVPYEITASQATIIFGGNNQTGSQGWAYLPNGTGRGSKPGDIWFHNGGPTAVGDPNNAVPGGYGILTYVHEIGHALGFKHPFDPPNNLPISVDTHAVTVMSYTNSTSHPEFPTTFMLYDLMEIQRVYGANTDYRTGNDQYFFDLTNTHRQILWDGGGEDTLNYANQNASATIDLRQGRWSSLNGVANSLMMGMGTVIENARGSRSDDVIHGNDSRNLLFGQEGNDRLIGDGGNDVLRGMQGNDTYVWRTGDGNDVIREERMGGVDVLEITDLTGNLDALEDDLTFYRTGSNPSLRDLRVELTINQGPSQGSITIADMAWGGSQVEILRFLDKDGEQIGNDIDLNSIYTGSTNLKQQFRVTEFQTNRGFIAVPV